MKREIGVIFRSAWVLLLAASAGVLSAQTIFPLPQVFTNVPSVGSSNSLWQSITNGSNYYRAYQCNQSNDFRRFRGAFTANASTTKLAIHSDDGSKVFINGGPAVLDFYGDNTHFQDPSALRLIPYTFTTGVEYCVQIDYTNNQHTAGDLDGVTLYAYDGGGSVRNGIAVWGPDIICLGNSITLNCCGDSAFTWMSSAPSIASLSGSGSSRTVQGLAPGTATITATDSNNMSGSRTVKVVRLGISPSYLETCEGLTHTFVITNADLTGEVTWSPTGSPSGNGRTNSYNFSTGGGTFNAGTNIITAFWNGCSGTATAVVVQAASLTASTNKLCVGGQVIYTAQSAPPGFEHFLNWSGEGLTGVGASRTNNYGTSGVKTVTVSCGTSTRSVNVTVHKADITNSVAYGLAGSSTPANFYLSTDSVGPFLWEISPFTGPTVSGGAVTIPAGSTPGVYTVKVYPTGLPSCSDTATLQVVQVTLPTDPISICKDSSTNLSFSVNPSSVLSLLTFDTVTNTSFGPANTHASVTVNNTNLTVTGTAGGTAYLRVKLGTTTLIGPTITIVQVTFPPEAWYVGVGKSADFNVTIVPSNAPVTFDTTAPGITTATAIPGGVRVTGVAPGTTQVRASVGGGAVCATKNVNAVRVTFDTNVVALCNNNSTSGVEAGVLVPFVHPGTFGEPLTQGLDTNWVLSLADADCKPYGLENDPSAPAGEEGCYGGLNNFEAAVIYTDPAGKDWYFPAGVTTNPCYDNKDGVIRVFESLVWIGLGDHDNNPATPLTNVVKKVEFRYEPLPSVPLCPSP